MTIDKKVLTEKIDELQKTVTENRLKYKTSERILTSLQQIRLGSRVEVVPTVPATDDKPAIAATTKTIIDVMPKDRVLGSEITTQRRQIIYDDCVKQLDTL